MPGEIVAEPDQLGLSPEISEGGGIFLRFRAQESDIFFEKTRNYVGATLILLPKFTNIFRCCAESGGFLLVL